MPIFRPRLLASSCPQPKRAAPTAKGPLRLRSGVWHPSLIECQFAAGENEQAVQFKNYEEARQYATAHGYSGIQIEYV